MGPTPSRRLAGRAGALLFAGNGLFTLAYLALSGRRLEGEATAGAVSLVAVAAGVVAWFFPWDRLHRRMLLTLVPVAFALVAAANSQGVNRPYTYGVYFIVIYAWIGMTHPQWTAAWFAPMGVIAYLTPFVLGYGTPADAASAALTIPAGVLVGEALSWTAGRERRMHDRAGALARVAGSLVAHLTEEDVFQTLVAEGRRAMGAEHAAFYSFDAEDSRIEHAAASGVADPAGVRDLVGKPVPTPEVLEELVRRRWVMPNAEQGAQLLPGISDPARTVLVAGIPVSGSLQGLLVYGHSSQKRTWSDADLELATAVATQAGVALRNALLYRRTAEAARRDPLTGLWNRRDFADRLHAECARAQRHEREVSLVVLDVDGLKAVNDAAGHAAGDRILQRVAGELTETIRRADGAFRIGGDEFALLLPETGTEGAVAVVDRLRRALGRPHADGSVTLSAGVATVPDHASRPDPLFEKADAALYVAKSAGGNAVAEAVRAAIEQTA